MQTILHEGTYSTTEHYLDALKNLEDTRGSFYQTS